MLTRLTVQQFFELLDHIGVASLEDHLFNESKFLACFFLVLCFLKFMYFETKKRCDEIISFNNDDDDNAANQIIVFIISSLRICCMQAE